MSLKELDTHLLRLMRTRGHAPETERAVAAFSKLGGWGAGWAALGAAAAAVDSRRRERWLRAATVGPAAIGLNYLVKASVRRPRPKLRKLPPLAGAPSSLSFPSAHATSSFAAATAISRIEPKAAPVVFATAAAMAASRPYLGMHYPSDALGGAVLGTALGLLVPGLRRNRARATEDRLMDLVASANGHGGPAQAEAAPASP